MVIQCHIITNHDVILMRRYLKGQNLYSLRFFFSMTIGIQTSWNKKDNNSILNKLT